MCGPSGAATADAFGDHLPEQGADDAHTLVPNVVDTHDDLASTGIDFIDGGDGGDDPSAQAPYPRLLSPTIRRCNSDGPVMTPAVHDADQDDWGSIVTVTSLHDDPDSTSSVSPKFTRRQRDR